MAAYLLHINTCLQIYVQKGWKYKFLLNLSVKFFKGPQIESDSNGKWDNIESVQIPKRGTSASSYGRDQKIHNELLQELDELFPSNQINNFTNQKFRAATLSIGR